MPPTTILVTGASGFISCDCVLDLLNHGYQVRGSVRNLGQTDALEATLGSNGADISKLGWVAASLTEPDNWSAAVEGCDAIFHVASPVPTIQSKTQLRSSSLPSRAHWMCWPPPLHMASIDVVLTSSVTAIFGGISPARPYTGGRSKPISTVELPTAKYPTSFPS